MSEIERLFRKEIRAKLPKRGRIKLKKTGTREARVAEQLLKNIFNGRREITWASEGYEATNLERELARQLAMFLENEALAWPATLMETIPAQLIAEYAEKAGINAPPADEPYPAIRALIEELQSQQEQTKPSLRKSFAALREKLKKNVGEER